MIAAIFGLAGPVLTREERAFFRDSAPAGYILFARNIVSPEQVRALTHELRALHGRADLPILIDQEGGRVSRMGPPVWPAFPPGAAFDRLYDIAPSSAIAAARLNAEALGGMLREAGITVDCLPLLDVRQPDGDAVIGDRALGAEPLRVAALGRATLAGLAVAGVVGVVKHMPGHGRALCDSHKALPCVTASDAELDAVDLAPFRALSDAPMAMTAHIVFPCWDAERPATLSPTVIAGIIRGRIGFDGLLMSDDIDMGALSGSIAERAGAAIAAGCDLVLNCWAKMDDMIAIAGAVGAISPAGAVRLDRAMASVAGAVPDPAWREAMQERDRLLAIAA